MQRKAGTAIACSQPVLSGERTGAVTVEDPSAACCKVGVSEEVSGCTGSAMCGDASSESGPAVAGLASLLPRPLLASVIGSSVGAAGGFDAADAPAACPPGTSTRGITRMRRRSAQQAEQIRADAGQEQHKMG